MSSCLPSVVFFDRGILLILHRHQNLILSQIQNDYIIANDTICSDMGIPIHLADPHNISLFFIHNSKKKNTLNHRKIYVLYNYSFILCIISHKPDRNRSGSALFTIFHQIHIHLTCRYYISFYFDEVLKSSRKF